jgi:hypothetical protein
MSRQPARSGWAIVIACLWLIACGESRLPATAVPQAIEPRAIVGEWYNTETGIYPDPSIAMVRFYPAGGIVMTGIDGSAQFGNYALMPDGRLKIRMALNSHVRLTVKDEPAVVAAAHAQLLEQPAPVIYDAIPVLSGQTLALQVPDRRLLFSREASYKDKVTAATVVFGRAQAAAQKAEEDRLRRLAEQRRRDNLRRVQTVLGIKTVLPLIKGAGASQCTRAVLAEMRRIGWKLTQDANQADAVLDVRLSAIQHKNSAWIGRYYKMTYAVKIRRAADQRVLAAFDGAERAAGQGPMEACTDTADDIVSEIEGLLDDLRD